MGKPKKQKVPPPAPPPAMAEDIPETEEQEIKRIRRKRGYARSIMAGGARPAPRRTNIGLG